MFRSKVRWTEQGEKPTVYFFNVEAKQFNQKTITELETSEGVKILKTFDFGKSPGKDAFTVDFCMKFFELLASDLVESLNIAYSRGEQPISQRRGVVTLIPKADSGTLKLTNWRPITLLNVDYKIRLHLKQ